MIRWNATAQPQHQLPAAAVREYGTSFRTSDQMNSKPPTREAPTSA